VLKDPEDLASLPVLGAIGTTARCTSSCSARRQFREIALEARLAAMISTCKTVVRPAWGSPPLPMMYCAEELQNGRLVQLLPDWSLPAASCRRYPHRRGLLPAVRAWIDHLAEAFARSKACFERPAQPPN
jgi:DNA-binding transcriptional LysR family regulator